MKKKKKLFLQAAVLILLIAAIVLAYQMVTLFYHFFADQSEDFCGSGAVLVTAVPGEEDTVIRQGDVSTSQVAITCNVDWGEDVLPDMLETLKKEDVKITFFISGKWAKKNPDLLRKIFVAGHEIQSHGYSHKLCSNITKDETREEIQKTQDVIEELTGRKPDVFAPPSGDYNGDTVQLCREMGYKLSLWSADTIDWRPGSSADIIKSRVLKKELHGGIILMHPKPETAKALPSLLKELKQKGLQVGPLSQLGVY